MIILKRDYETDFELKFVSFVNHAERVEWHVFITEEGRGYTSEDDKRLFDAFVHQLDDVTTNVRIGVRNSVKRFGRLETKTRYTALYRQTENSVFGVAVGRVLSEWKWGVK